MDKLPLKSNIRRIIFVIGILNLSFLYNNCSQPGAIALNSANQAALGNGGAGGGGGAGQDTHYVLKTLQPALAVRGMACLMCHADVRANIITDFGYGNSWYLGGASNLEGSGSSGNGAQSWYNNDAHSWQTAKQIIGSIYVPNQKIPASIQNDIGQSLHAPMSIQELLTTPYNAIWNWDNDPAQQHVAMDFRVTPPAGAATVIGASSIVISAPTESEILALAPSLVGTGASYLRVNSVGAVQFQIKGSGQAAYIKNDESAVLECENADIVVNGTLYLRNLQVRAAGGCRIYATGTIFIENQVTYVGGQAGDSTLQNLQLSSANAIIMGIDSGHLQTRYGDRRQAMLSGARSFEDRFQQVMSEATSIGVLADAAAVSPRTSIDFTGLLLNAPIVQGRYLGKIRGTIIAELALFALGAFHFEFDPVFTEVDVLPILTRPVLTVTK